MAKPTMNTIFKATPPRAETLIDKTTRAAREILDEETAQHEAKTARLRKARLEREAGTPIKAPNGKSTGARKKPQAKVVR
jgi:hypothetical protein